MDLPIKRKGSEKPNWYENSVDTVPGLKFNHSDLENRLMSLMTVVDRPETVLFNTKIIKNIIVLQ